MEALFEQALALPTNERAAFLAQNCDGETELKKEVESLLDSHASAGDFLAGPGAQLPADVFNEIGRAAVAGQRIGPYRIVRELGRGGMGSVYLAERADQQYEKQVAIKLIKRGMDTDSVLRHFRNERQILAGFDHPNIARLFDGGTTPEGLPYFVMEYVAGTPIDQYCREHDLPLRERLKLFLEVCGAVTYAHRRTVIHRDLKPSNVLLTSDGIPKLLDFGIAKVLQAGEGEESLMTVAGARAMTPEYASPEQVRGDPVTTASDVYSLGVVLYELLTGISPYRITSRAPREVERAVTETEPVRPSAAFDQQKESASPARTNNQKLLRGDLDNILLMALRKEPARRYQSVEQFSEDIRRHLEARPVLARKDNLGYRATKFIRRNRVATAAAALVFLSLIAGVIATTWQAHRARVEEARAERRFNDVRRLAHSVLFDYHDAIKDLPGATKVREQLVKDALRYLDSLAGEATGDPALQRELAAAYDRVGDVRGAAYGASLGDRTGATESYEKALRIRQALAAATPRDITARRELAVSYQKVGTQLSDTAEASRGLDHLEKSLALAAQLVAEQPQDPQLQAELAGIRTQFGLALESRGEIARALHSYRQATPIYEQLLSRDPASRPLRRGLSVTDENIGRALFLNNDVPAALANNQKALQLRETLLAEDPTNADYRRILGVSYQNNGDYRAWMKDAAGALTSFQKKIALDEAAVAADPANAQARADLAYAALRIGDLLSEQNEYSQSLLYYRRALELYEGAMAANPEDAGISLRVAWIKAHQGKAEAKLGNVAAAREACVQGARLLAGIPTDRANADQCRSRVIASVDLGDAFATLADLPESSEMADQDRRAARDLYQQGLNLMQDLRARGILDDDEAKEMETTARKIAACDNLSRR